MTNYPVLVKSRLRGDLWVVPTEAENREQAMRAAEQRMYDEYGWCDPKATGVKHD